MYGIGGMSGMSGMTGLLYEYADRQFPAWDIEDPGATPCAGISITFGRFPPVVSI